MTDLHSFVFKGAHARLKRTMEGFYSLSLLVQLISQLSCVIITEIPRALFSGACQIISTASTLNASQPNSFLLSVSALQSSPCLWGLVLACGLAVLAGSRSGTGLTPSSSQPTHSSVYVHAGVIPGGPLGL